MQIQLKFDSPIKLIDHFEVPEDGSVWSEHSYVRTIGRNGRNTGQTPVRQRAEFARWQNALVPKSDFGKSVSQAFGIYLLAFSAGQPAIYVGIAAAGGRAPEGILNRIKKHRVKSTGSHVGPSAESCGGVNHTCGWREYAVSRAAHFQRASVIDRLEDVRLIVGRLNPAPRTSDKEILERFEASIFSNYKSVGDKICHLLWPTIPADQVRQLTRAVAKRPVIPGRASIVLWNREVVDC